MPDVYLSELSDLSSGQKVVEKIINSEFYVSKIVIAWVLNKTNSFVTKSNS